MLSLVFIVSRVEGMFMCVLKENEESIDLILFLVLWLKIVLLTYIWMGDDWCHEELFVEISSPVS